MTFFSILDRTNGQTMNMSPGYNPTNNSHMFNQQYSGHPPVQDILDEAILDIVRTHGTGYGVHISEIMSSLLKKNQKSTLLEVKKKLAQHIDHGTMYLGADDDRYCAL